MVKIIKADVILAAFAIGAWILYFMCSGATRYDINETMSLPLFLAIWLTAMALLYAIGRHYNAKKGALITKTISKLVQDQQPENEQHEAQSDSTKS